jgi:hypothetical protein
MRPNPHDIRKAVAEEARELTRSQIEEAVKGELIQGKGAHDD